MTIIALLLCGCVNIDCKPDGKILFGTQVAPGMTNLISAVDGGMAGVSCSWRVNRDGHR